MAQESTAEEFDELFWRDEVLEAMYWMMGEGIEEAIEPADLRSFLDAPPNVVDRTFRRLAADGHLDESDDGYVFTEQGEAAAKKRFADEFSDIQGFDEAHTACSADCWCHDPEHAEDECPTHGHDHDHDHSH